MIRILATVFLVATCLSSHAETSDEASVKNRKIETQNYCYYADLKYSEGAEMDQHGIRVRCVRAKDSELHSTVPANVLVWQKLD